MAHVSYVRTGVTAEHVNNKIWSIILNKILKQRLKFI